MDLLTVTSTKISRKKKTTDASIKTSADAKRNLKTLSSSSSTEAESKEVDEKKKRRNFWKKWLPSLRLQSALSEASKLTLTERLIRGFQAHPLAINEVLLLVL